MGLENAKKCPYCLGFLDPNTGECRHCGLLEKELTQCHCDKKVDVYNLSSNFEYLGCDEENNPVFRCRVCGDEVWG